MFANLWRSLIAQLRGFTAALYGWSEHGGGKNNCPACTYTRDLYNEIR